MPRLHRSFALSFRSSLSLALAPILAVAAGCEAPRDARQVQAIQDRLTLTSFSDCAALESYIEDTAVRDMELQLDQTVETGWYRGWAVEDGVVPAYAGATPKTTSGPAAYTKTNTQVAGVDEADFMKNDGTSIFVLSGQRLVAARSWPPQDLAVAGKLNIEGYPREMFLDESHRVVVISDVYAPFLVQPEVGSQVGDAKMSCYAYSYACAGASATKVTVVDATDLAAMKVVNEMYLPGGYRSSRRIGSSVRVVLSDSFQWPNDLSWYPTYDPENPNRYSTEEERRAWATSAKAANAAKIRASTLSQWLPSGRRKLADGTLLEVGYSCQDFNHANAPVRLGLATIATIDLNSPEASPARTSVIGEVGEIYASQTSLYLASWHWWWWPVPGQIDYTYLHKFDITQPNRAVYVASGGVEGHIVDQFSMDEHQGFLRVATTITTRETDPSNPENTWGVLSYTNLVSVLGEKSGALQVVGKTPELSKGERVYSSRFLGDKGFVVTFRQMDPLFTLDLSQPTAPKVVGELKVPGFSTYIHPIDAGHLLTIGVDVPESGSGERHIKLSLFDVTDFANPKEAFTQIVGTAWGWSEATYEHKAFNYFPEKKLLAIPFSDWLQNTNGYYWDSFVSDVRVFEIDAEKGISPRGAITMKDVYLGNSQYAWDWWYSPWVRRSVMASDDAGQTFVYAVSDAGIRVANLTSLATPLQTAVIGPEAPSQ